ncbi:MAG: hypothetical protein SynsKO_20710 [Synoicihabitans sp.]
MNSKTFIWSVIHGLKREVCGPSVSSMTELKNSAMGETCFLIGNGPSLAKIENTVLERFPSIGTNGIFLKYTPQYYVTISLDFYKNHIDSIRSLGNCKKFLGDDLVSIHTNSANEYIISCNWHVYGKLMGFSFPVPLRFSKNADRVVYLGGSVMFVCLQLAYWIGYRRVVLVGVDHQFGFPRSEASYGGHRLETKNEDLIHFDKGYSKPGSMPHCDMIAMERSFKIALNAFRKDGREILNATEGTGLDVIPKVKLNELY